MQLSDYELGFLVGLIEGEGSLYILKTFDKRVKRFRYVAFLTIVNTDENLLQKAAQILSSKYTFYKSSNKNWKRRGLIMIAKKDKLLEILRLLEPHLVSKKKEIAKLMIKFLESRLNKTFLRNPRTGRFIASFSEEEIRIYEKVRELNARGSTWIH